MQPTEVLTVAGAPNKKWNASWFVVMNFLFFVGVFLAICLCCPVLVVVFANDMDDF